jgi:tetratricopeptide (TPR) repeat protein|tara:strand:+ start:670 stop:1335 length:666 start_codon:yes stop_codon:yes gene_type:complete
MKKNSDEPKDFKTLSQLGQAYQTKHQFQKALACYKQAYATIKNQASPDDLIVALVNMGAIYWEMSQLRKATDLFHDSLLIVERIGDDVGRRMLYSIIGISSWRKGEFVKAIEWFEAALKVSTEAKVEYERSQIISPWKYEILLVVMERGIVTLKNRIQIAQNQHDAVRILLPSFSMVPLMLFTGRKGAIPILLKELVPLAKELKNNKILNTITALEKIIRI